jgi:hypothetical protein
LGATPLPCFLAWLPTCARKIQCAELLLHKERIQYACKLTTS